MMRLITSSVPTEKTHNFPASKFPDMAETTKNQTLHYLFDFYDHCIKDPQLKPSHIAVYMALFQLWCLNRCINPISINRNEVMLLAKIGSIATYHNCMKHLHEQSYITYKPSKNPYKSSMVIIKKLTDPH